MDWLPTKPANQFSDQEIKTTPAFKKIKNAVIVSGKPLPDEIVLPVVRNLIQRSLE